MDARADYESTHLELEASEARSRFYNYRALAWGSAGMAIAFGVSGAVILFWPETSASPAASGALRFEGVGINGTGLTTWGTF
jgi:putative exporter of polyketide antibiotics